MRPEAPRSAPERALSQFTRFAMVGVVNTLTSSALYLAMTRLVRLPPLAANAIAFVVSASLSYLLNKYWTFRDPRPAHARQYPLFILVGAIGLLLSETILWVLHSRLGVHDFIAFLAAVGVVMFWNFGASRGIVFRPSRPSGT
jgi:putative flippase GtrA